MAIPRGLQVATAHPTARARAQEGPDPAGGTNSSSWHRGGTGSCGAWVPPTHRDTPSLPPYLGGRKLLCLLCVGKPRRKKLLLHCQQSPRHPANPGAALER